MNKKIYFEEHDLIHLKLISEKIETLTDNKIAAINKLLQQLIKQLNIGIDGNYLVFFEAINQINKILIHLRNDDLFETKDKIKEEIATSVGFLEVYEKSKEVVIKIFNNVDLSTVSIYSSNVNNNSIGLNNMSTVISDNYQWYQKYNVFYSRYFNNICEFIVYEKDDKKLKDYCNFINYIQNKESVMFNPYYLHKEKILDIFIENIKDKDLYIDNSFKKILPEIMSSYQNQYFKDSSNKSFIKKIFKETQSSSNFISPRKS